MAVMMAVMMVLKTVALMAVMMAVMMVVMMVSTHMIQKYHHYLDQQPTQILHCSMLSPKSYQIQMFVTRYYLL